MSSPSRPLSPHIQIYRPQLTSILSISHRISGIALSAGAVLFVGQLLAAASGPASFGSFQHFVGSWFGLALLVAWSAAFFFHLANGIRHLFWDAGYGFDLPSTYRSGAAVLAATVGLTALTWVAVLATWRH
jgi:succinate dehydrogenase / fumarate reductase cytochrome b subunit